MTQLGWRPERFPNWRDRIDPLIVTVVARVIIGPRNTLRILVVAHMPGLIGFGMLSMKEVGATYDTQMQRDEPKS